MAEMKFNTKGPAGIIIGLLVLAGVVYYQFFMPVTLVQESGKKWPIPVNKPL